MRAPIGGPDRVRAKSLTGGGDCASQPASPSARNAAPARGPTAPAVAARGARSGGGQGAEPPLDSIPSEIAPNLPRKAGDSPTAGQAARARARAAQPVSLTADEHREQTSRALERLGQRWRAQSLRTCGRTASVYPCKHCGDPLGLVVRRLHCGSRACPDCARAAAARRVRELAQAVEHVAPTVAARAPAQLVAEQRAELAALDRAAYWTHEDRAHHKRAGEHAARAYRDAADARWRAGRVREAMRGAWGWKLVTIAPQWDPSDPREVSPAGLRRRGRELLDALGRVLARRYGVGGLAAWSVSAESSEGGHVHAHALSFGPWLHTEAFAREVAHELGRAVYVDARKARSRDGRVDARSAAREALKYALKGPSPRRSSWVTGRARGRVPAPELSAALVVGWRGLQTVRHYGTARDAQRAARAARKRTEPARLVCATCGLAVDPQTARLVDWRAVVRALVSRGEWQSCERGRASGPADRVRWLAMGPVPSRMPARVRTIRVSA